MFPARLPVTVIAAAAAAAMAAAPAAAQPVAWWLDSPAARSDRPGAAGAGIDAPHAWQTATGAGQTVAALDTGVTLTHPQLRAGLWTNPAEIPANRRDDDRNGIVDDVHGADLVSGDGVPQDVSGHGSHVAGIINAALDDDPLTGVAPAAKVMAVRILDHTGWAPDRRLSAGVRYAVRHGASVINLSVGGFSARVCRALRWAAARDVVIVAAAGNQRENLDRLRRYPASCAARTLLTVAAHDADGRRAAFSARGRRSVQLAAPGVSILSAARHGSQVRDGTSMAAAVVSAAAAVVRSARPQLTAGQTVAALTRSAVADPRLGVRYGRLDLAAAVQLADASRRQTVTARGPRR